ncbi:MAG TPA: hypothetical protein VHV47_03635 [Opitutaceae bacterium]|jgi:hypothetical protein|nr:hypothetical protein [Opitutaceae bacterium]
MPSGNELPPRRPWIAALLCAALAAGAFYAGRLSAPPHRSTAGVPAPRPILHPAAAAVAAPAQPGPVWNAMDWRQLKGQPATLARNQTEEAMLEALAAADPQQAMGLAQSEHNLVLRQELEQAALRGWAKTAPGDAIKWAFGLSNVSDRNQAVIEIFKGAVAANPAMAIQAAQANFSADPGNAGDYGNDLIEALVGAGHSTEALQFAASGDSRLRPDWTTHAYELWAQLQPQEAANDAAALSDPEARSAALHGVVGGWSQADPGGLTQFLAQMPPDADRAQMLGQSLQAWVKTDLPAASEWINNSAGGPDLDKGVAAVASLDSIKPDVAVSWAESISDGPLRSSTLADVLRNWAQTDYAAAQQYFQKTGDLQPDDRQRVAQILSDLQPH